MAQAKITELPELTSVATTDVLAIVDDPGGSPVTKKITVANLLGNVTAGVYNVLDYGATGDGTTDDTTAIQAALTACGAAGGGVVLFPATADAYRCTAQITVPTKTTLLGHGATIYQDGFDDSNGTPYRLFYIDTVTEHIAFDGLHFLGKHVAGNAFPAPGGVMGNIITFWHPDGTGDFRHDHVRISHCVFEDIAGYPFYIEFARDAEITNNRIVNSYGINCNAAYTRMSGNYFTTCGGFEGAGVHLIITGNTWQAPLATYTVVSLGGYITPTPPVYQPGVVFSGNTIKDWAGSSLTCVLIQESAENVQIVGNSLTSLTGANCIGIGNYMGTAGHEQRGFIIANNNMSNVAGTAIYLIAHSGRTTDVLISGNRIGKQSSSNVSIGIYCEIPGTTIGHNVVYTTDISVYLNGATNVRLVDNDLSSSGSVPVYLTGGATLAYANVYRLLTATKSWTPDSTADGATATTTVDVTGCAIGDTVLLNLGDATIGVLASAHAHTDVVRVNIFNKSGGAWNPGAITTRVSVLKFSTVTVG